MTLSTSAVAVCCWKGFAQLVEQTGILDGDDGLIGEILYQCYLLVREGANLLAHDCESTHQLIVLQHRDREYCPIAAQIDAGYHKRMTLNVGLYSLDVGDMDYLLRDDDTPKGRVRRRLEQLVACARLDIGGRRVVRSSHTEGVSVAEVQIAKLGLADAHGVCQHGLEHRLQLAGRARNDAEHLGSCGLLLQRFGKIVGAMPPGDEGDVGGLKSRSASPLPK